MQNYTFSFVLCKALIFVSLAMLSVTAPSARGQVFNSGPSSSSQFDTVLNLPTDANIGDSANIGNDGFSTQLNVADGGIVGDRFEAFSGSEVNISGGTVGASFDAETGSEVNISGGTVGIGFRAESGSEVNISGGTVSRLFTAESGSDVELIGGEFKLNGATFGGSTITLTSGDTFTGTLADGSAFIFFSEELQLSTETLEGVRLTAVSLPSVDLSPIVIDTPALTGPSGLREGQTLTVQSGGGLGDSFEAVTATLNVEGGALGDFAGAIDSVVNVSGGSVGDGFAALLGSEVNISGGTVGIGFEAHLSSEVNISGGTVGDRFVAASGSEVNISGGEVGELFFADPGSEVNISGGSVGDGFIARSGTVNISGGAVGDDFRALPGSEINLFGSEFLIGDVLLDDLELGQVFTIDNREVTLSGLLADGSAFSFDLNSSFAEDTTVTVTAVASVPEPTSFAILGLGSLLVLGRRRRLL